QKPVADAGDNISVTLPMDSVTLDGTASQDPDGSIAQYHWSKVSGPAAGNILEPDAASTSVKGLNAGTYIFQLKVTDNKGAADSALVKVPVRTAPDNQKPVADAGDNISVTLPLDSVTLDGSAPPVPDASLI